MQINKHFKARLAIILSFWNLNETARNAVARLLEVEDETNPSVYEILSSSRRVDGSMYEYGSVCVLLKSWMKLGPK